MTSLMPKKRSRYRPVEVSDNAVYGPPPMTITSFVRHSVPDYNAWRKAFDDFHEARDLKKPTVYQGAEEPNDVTVVAEFDSLEEAKEFFETVVKEGLAAAGIQDALIWFTEAVS